LKTRFISFELSSLKKPVEKFEHFRLTLFKELANDCVLKNNL